MTLVNDANEVVFTFEFDRNEPKVGVPGATRFTFTARPLRRLSAANFHKDSRQTLLLMPRPGTTIQCPRRRARASHRRTATLYGTIPARCRARNVAQECFYTASKPAATRLQRRLSGCADSLTATKGSQRNDFDTAHQDQSGSEFRLNLFGIADSGPPVQGVVSCNSHGWGNSKTYEQHLHRDDPAGLHGYIRRIEPDVSEYRRASSGPFRHPIDIGETDRSPSRGANIAAPSFVASHIPHRRGSFSEAELQALPTIQARAAADANRNRRARSHVGTTHANRDHAPGDDTAGDTGSRADFGTSAA